MSEKLDKTLILNRIKAYYKFKKDIEFASFLGIASNTLGNWHSRNTMNFDRVFTKCERLNPNWIINGVGRPNKDYDNLQESITSEVEDLEQDYRLKNFGKETERLTKLVSLQEETIAAQAKTIAVMERLIDRDSTPSSK